MTGNGPGELAPPATPPASSKGPAPSPAPAPERIGDDQVLGAIHVMNQGEIDLGKLARGKAKDAKVKRFADLMVKHHGEADAKAAAIGKKYTLQPAATHASADLASSVREMTTALTGQAGSEFDKTYMDVQVKGHQGAIELIDTKLAPGAQAPELKAYVDAMRTKIVQHLTDAKEIRAKL